VNKLLLLNLSSLHGEEETHRKVILSFVSAATTPHLFYGGILRAVV